MCDPVWQYNESFFKELEKTDYTKFFDDSVKNYFKESDLVVGNLETPITTKYYEESENPSECGDCYAPRFSAPQSFAEAIKNAGVNLVSTANNHCLDQGINGLVETMQILNNIDLKYVGTNFDPDTKNTGVIMPIGHKKIGFLSYTYGTNALCNGIYLKEKERYVNLYQQQELHNKLYRKIYKSNFAKLFRKFISRAIRKLKIPQICNRLKIPAPNIPKTTTVYDWQEKKTSWHKKIILDDIKNLKNNGADYLVMLLHAGGQSNDKPLSSARKICNSFLNNGVDAVITNHEHVVQNYEQKKNKIITYCLGNFVSSMAKNSELYAYSIIFNIYFVDNIEIKYSFSIAKTILKNDVPCVHLLFDLIQNCNVESEKAKLIENNAKFYKRFTGKDVVELQKEYFL